ncbi:PKD domain-containing protein [Pedobacter jamesrossensis]|uniref:PKD domain-containing protein n=1 Tax=Pedobacter jamesrossensis TaxID=1908238 RepID=A0ABV8NSH7_9SPHI
MKKIKFFNNVNIMLFSVLIAMLISSCKYQEVAEVSFAEQKIYLPAASVAALGIGGNGIYNINTLATPGQVFRYVINSSANKFNVPLGVYRSGTQRNGVVNVNITTPTDTVTKLISNNFLANTVLLPANRYTIEQSVTIPDGAEIAPFTISVDLPYLLSNLNTNHAIAVRVASPNVASNILYNNVVIVINPAFLIPTSQFTSIVNGKSVSFNNISTNGVNYSWNFGDGSQAVTTKSPSHVYTNSGTYTVTLTSIGALGATNQAISTNVVVVP